MYICIFSLNSAPDGGGWLTLLSGRFTPGNDSVPIVLDDLWVLASVWTGVENFASTGIRSPNLLAVASCYSDYAIPAPV